ncbi:MAG: hypothetical protein RLZZ435_3269 [Cyanobacteriota bacterium]|jgi:hypothetical protein
MAAGCEGVNPETVQPNGGAAWICLMGTSKNAKFHPPPPTRMGVVAGDCAARHH